MKIYQYQTSIVPYDAMSNNVFEIDKLLQDNGYETAIFADQHDKRLPCEILRPDQISYDKNDLLIFHFGIGKDFFNTLKDIPCKKIMVYHNITPPKYTSNPTMYAEARRGIHQLSEIVPYVDRAIAVSEFNAKDLIKRGYKNVKVIPFLRDLSDLPQEENEELKDTLSKIDSLIFIGRISPQKRHIDIVKAFYFYKKYFNTNAKLFFIGGYGEDEEVFINLRNAINKLQLKDDVILTGKVSDSDMLTYLKNSKLFVSMSEHEGFCVPVVEAMAYQLPILAYFYGGAVADTAGTGAVFFTEKDPMTVAGLMNETISNLNLNDKIKENQRKELERFQPLRIKKEILQVITDTIHGN